MGAMIIYWLWSRWKTLSSRESSAAYLSVVCLLIHASLELPHHYAYFLVPAGLWIGLIEYGHNKLVPMGATKENHLPSSLFVAISAFCFLVFVGILKEYIAIEENFRQMRFDTLRIGISGKNPEPMESTIYLTNINAYINFQRTPFDSQLSENTLDNMEAATKRYPYAGSLYRTAIAMAVNNRPESAYFYFLAIRHMHSPAIYAMALRNASEQYASQGNEEIAFLLKRLTLIQ